MTWKRMKRLGGVLGALALAAACTDGGSGQQGSSSGSGPQNTSTESGTSQGGQSSSSRGPTSTTSSRGGGATSDARDAGTPDSAVVTLPDAGPVEGCEDADIPPGPRPTRLMTRAEYNNVVRDLLADTTRPADSFPAENTVLGFDNNADTHIMNPTLLESLMTAAESVSHRAVTDRFALVVACDPAIAGEDICGELFTRRFGTQAFRRPILATELNALLDLFHAQRMLYGFNAAIELVIQTILQSPQFLYRVEGTPDGITGRYTVDSYTMASRLSFFLWNSIPDETLMTAAANGAVQTRDQVETQARRMLSDSRARDAVRNFHRQWMHVDGLRIISKDTNVYGMFNETLRDAWQESVYRFVDSVFWDGDAKLSTLLTDPSFFVDERLAPIYGSDGTPTGDGWLKVTRSTERAGLLTQPGLMALLAAPNQSSPIRRGLWVREKFMCEPPRSPPPGANFSPPAVDPSATTRERFAQHTHDPGCQSCHIFIDPVGFGLERFDGMGRYRATEANQDVDDSGEIVGPFDPSLEGAFHGAQELAAKLAQAPSVEECVVRQHLRAAFGRADVEQDACTTRQITRIFHMTGGDMRELLVAIATHDAFRTADAAPEVMP